jgi:TorA maturation chaperone TorD
VSGGLPAATAAPPLDPEDAARANLYALVSRLFYAPADPNFLAEIARAEPGAAEDEESGVLRAAWQALQEACRGAFPAHVGREYDNLFVGVGKAEVTPYLSAYAEPRSPERYLVRLRDQLAEWELMRRDSVFEVEDHISGLCDVMRWLVEQRHALGEQRVFFDSYVYAGALPFFAAVQKAASAAFYKPVAAFATTFFEIEREAFDMVDAAG